MTNWIKIKLRIGEIIEQNINNENVRKTDDFNCDGECIYISFQKSPNSHKILIDVTTDEYVFKFSYPNNHNNKFDMAQLNCDNSYPKEMDD